MLACQEQNFDKLTKLRARHEIGCRLVCIKHCSRNQGTDGEHAIVNVRKRILAFIPTTESLSVADRRPMAARTSSCEVASGVGHLGDRDVVLSVQVTDTVAMICVNRIRQQPKHR